jgi:hypothetical protein
VLHSGVDLDYEEGESDERGVALRMEEMICFRLPFCSYQLRYSPLFLGLTPEKLTISIRMVERIR